MQKNNSPGYLANLRNDLPASIVVLLVAVPLCLGIALASGAPLFSGIIAGIVGGIVVTAFSGSQLGVSGPAAGLAVVVLNSIEQLGAFENFLLAVVIAGVIQVLLGVFKTGVFGYYLPSSVIKGMLSGIGLIIILKQIPHAFGYDKDTEGDMGFQQADGHNTFTELYYMLDGITPGAIVVSLVCLAILILWERPFMKKLSFTKILPGALVAVIVGIVLNISFEGNTLFDIHGEHEVRIPVAESFSKFIGQFRTPNWSMIFDKQIWIVAFTVAIIASIETLLCVEATDKMDPERRITPTNRELIAQGIGNSVSGLIGGLPITQVIVRSSANIQSGGRTKTSAFMHGVLMLLFAITIPHILNLIPLASLAAILLVVGYKLINLNIIKSMYKTGNAQFYSYVATVLGIVFTDLLVGIGIGMAVAIVFILWNNFKSPYHFDPDAIKEGEPIKIELSEDVSFLNKASMMKTFTLIPDGSHVIIDASRSRDVHWDILELIEDYKIHSEMSGTKLELIGFDDIGARNSAKDLQAHVAKND